MWDRGSMRGLGLMRESRPRQDQRSLQDRGATADRRPTVDRQSTRYRRLARNPFLLAALLLASAAVCLPALAANDTTASQTGASQTPAAKTEVFDRTIPLPSGGTFSLTNVNGSIAVEGWDREAVAIHAVKTAPQSADLSRVRIDTDTGSGPGRVSVATVYPRDNDLLHGNDDDVEVSVDYTVRVPRRVLLEQLATVNGAVRVSGVEGRGELRSVNGDIDVLGSSGGFSARTTNGGVYVQLLRLTAPGALALETVNGGVALALPPNAAATLDARSLNGDFHSDLPMTLLSAYSPRGVQGRVGAGGVPIRLRTVNGAIRILTLPQGV